MKYKEIKWDITTLPERYVIAHCISADCAMGAGVVIPIRNQHPTLKDKCKEFAKGKDVVGTAYRHIDEKGVVYNMFTKSKCSQNAQTMREGEYLNNLKACLEQVRDCMRLNDEHYLGLPRIGCGLDRCDWNDVSKIIQDVFSEEDVFITICIWP